MTASFVRTFFGRVFNYPFAVFTGEMLRPELQDMAVPADGVDTIVATHKRVAESYFADGIEMACLPLKACCTSWPAAATKDASSIIPVFVCFSAGTASWPAPGMHGAWKPQKHDIKLWRRHATYLENFLKKEKLRRGSPTLGHPRQIGISLGHLSQGQDRRIPGRPARHHWPATSRKLKLSAMRFRLVAVCRAAALSFATGKSA